jgi:two-component SAPR family response regulator
MPAYTAKIFFLLILLGTLDVHAQTVHSNLDYGLRFASHEVTKDHRTSLNLTPEDAFHFDKDFEIRFDVAFQRLTNAYGYVLRIIANDTLNIDLVSSPEHDAFSDLNLIINNKATSLHYDFSDVGLHELQWKQIAIVFSHEKNQVSLRWGRHTKIQDFPVSALDTFRFVFGANDYGKFQTSDVPPVILKDIAIWKANRLIRKWGLRKHLVTEVYDSVGNAKATVSNPTWLLDEHTRWIHRKQFVLGKYPSVAFNSESGVLYATDEKNMYIYDVLKGSLKRNESIRGNPVFTDANQLIYIRETGELVNYSVHTNKFLSFNFNENSWGHTDTLYHKPVYWHQNKFYNPLDSSLYAFGGYGHFSYKKSFFRYDASSGNWSPIETKGLIPPRYLAASGMNHGKDKVLIFGGYGSISGKQELFPQVFYDLYTFDLKSHRINKVWELESSHTSEDIVFSNSLVTNEKDSCFYVLTFPKNKYESYIKMRRYALSKPESTILADSIPFLFHDEDAFADLFISGPTNELIAVTSHKEKDQFKINVYSIKYAPLNRAEVLQLIESKKVNASLYYFIVGGLFCTALLYVFGRKKGSSHLAAKEPETIIKTHSTDSPVIQNLTEEQKRAVSVVNLFGGFQVIDKSGQDITGKFTITLKELFLLILLYSIKFEKGISATELQEYVWPDKDEISARNNRNVNIKKLRGLLNEIGTVSIMNNNAYLRLSIGSDVFCDYQTVFKMLNAPSEEVLTCENIKIILANVRRGNLLPNLQAAWLDNFKSDISNRIIDLLVEYSQKLDAKEDSKVLIDIADAIFNYDSINQEALIIKCSVLNKKGKYALAKGWYEHFVKEYRTLYAENYPRSFEEVIS